MKPAGFVAWVFVFVAGLLLSGDLDAGSLEPPGPPAPTMKTLDQVEARIPISSLPFTISQPGSYYLTRDLTGAVGQAGVTITASFVTFDLNGFSLIGVPGSSQGIIGTGVTEHVVIKNGVVRNWGARGISALTSTDWQIADMRLDANGNDGAWVGPRSSVRDTTATSNVGAGIATDVNNTITRCTVAFNNGGLLVGPNSVVSSSTAFGNTSVGIGAAQGSLVIDSTAQQNTGTGIQLTQAGNRVFHSVSRANGVGITASEGGTIEDCTVESNGDDGIRIGTRGIARGNLVRANTGDGIEATGTEARIEENLTSLNAVGMRLTGTNNLVIKNNFSANTTTISAAAGNRIATFTNDPNAANPWGNFSL